MYADAHSLRAAPRIAGELYLTNTVVNGRVLVRYKRGNLAAGWLPIKPHTVRRVVICQQATFS